MSLRERGRNGSSSPASKAWQTRRRDHGRRDTMEQHGEHDPLHLGAAACPVHAAVAILRQNPAFHAAMTSPVGSLYITLEGALSQRNETTVFLNAG